MNERIKELAKHSHFHSDDIWLHQYRLEKFAKLIVDECLDIIGHGIDHTDYDDPEKSIIELKAQLWCRDAIREHFGVK